MYDNCWWRSHTLWAQQYPDSVGDYVCCKGVELRPHEFLFPHYEEGYIRRTNDGESNQVKNVVQVAPLQGIGFRVSVLHFSRHFDSTTSFLCSFEARVIADLPKIATYLRMWKGWILNIDLRLRVTINHNVTANFQKFNVFFKRGPWNNSKMPPIKFRTIIHPRTKKCSWSVQVDFSFSWNILTKVDPFPLFWQPILNQETVILSWNTSLRWTPRAYVQLRSRSVISLFTAQNCEAVY